jgi:hypothetical protein
LAKRLTHAFHETRNPAVSTLHVPLHLRWLQHGHAAQDRLYGMVCIDAVSRGGADDRSDIGEQIGTQLDRNPPVTVRLGGCRPQFSFTAIIVGRRIGMREKGEQVAADFAIAFAKTLAVLIGGSQSHDRVQFAIQPLPIGATRARGQAGPATGQHNRLQQQRLRAGREGCIARLDGECAVAQLMRRAHLPAIGMPPAHCVCLTAARGAQTRNVAPPRTSVLPIGAFISEGCDPDMISHSLRT